MNSPPRRPWFLSLLRVCLVIQFLLLAVIAYGVYPGGSWSSVVPFVFNALLLIGLVTTGERVYRQRRRDHFAHHPASPDAAEQKAATAVMPSSET
ncbi:hypothetical protein [Nocardiopsis sp. CA-288880]|uniref:hypothetical protein n=1 Tax=Nocardiopsis sp. CA-288880 TaxID=3239995 RepID=UPI003D990156